MVYQEIVSQVKQWPPHEQARLVTALMNLLAEQLEPPVRRKRGSSLDRVLGMLETDAPPPSDKELEHDYVNYLIGKYE